ncbi:MAG: deoxyribose-phosphate aldolase, partial [Selenomonadaceae bacterium]|nr:deoxyribose-phosphate aldolase [Selenomonadaceae bacterium]
VSKPTDSRPSRNLQTFFVNNRPVKSRLLIAALEEEIDMVLNIGLLKAHRDAEVQAEIMMVHDSCRGKLVKVIIETCLLTEEEKIRACHLVTEAGAEYIKTSTGFSTGGATFEDVALLRKHVGPNVKVKAAGGISSFADAEKFIELGADRLGTSRLVKLMKQEEGWRY